MTRGREALTAVVNRCIADGAPVIAEVPARYMVVKLRGGMIGYYGLRDTRKGERVIGVHLPDRERMQSVADSWNRRES